MQIITDLDFKLKNSAVCIGKFDGLHRGHMLLVEAVKGAEDTENVMFTFSFGDKAKSIYTADEKRKICAEIGIDTLVEVPFDMKLKNMSPEEFFREILIDRCDAKYVCVGNDFRFGKDRAGDAALLTKMGRESGIDVEIIEKLKYKDEVIASSVIRESIANGNLDKGREMLGRKYSIWGNIEHGKKIGRQMGFPTANIIPPEQKLLPPKGVYITNAHIGSNSYHSITNVGNNPTVSDGSKTTIETYIFGFEGDIYNEKTEIEFEKYIRDEKKFDSKNALMHQIERDIEEMKSYFGIESKN